MPELGNDMSQASFGFEDSGLPIADDSVFVGLGFALSGTDIGSDLRLVSLFAAGDGWIEPFSLSFADLGFEGDNCVSPPRSFFCRDEVRCFSTDGRTSSLLLEARPAPAPKKSNAAKILVTRPMLIIAMIKRRRISRRAAARDGRLAILFLFHGSRKE